MSASIRPNRMEVSDRFPVLGFTVRTERSHPYFEIALASDPTLFQGVRKGQRSSSNFFSTRVFGPLQAEREETVYLVPAEVMSRFVGKEKLYYALALFPDPSRARAEVASLPTPNSPWVNLRAFTGRALRWVSGVPNPRGGLAGNGSGYSQQQGDMLNWAGDTLPTSADSAPAKATAPAPVPTPTPAPRASAPPVAAQSGLAGAFDYDDGFDPSLWSQPLAAPPAEMVDPTDEPALAQSYAALFDYDSGSELDAEYGAKAQGYVEPLEYSDEPEPMVEAHAYAEPFEQEAEPEHGSEVQSYATPFDYTEEPESIAEAHTYAEPFEQEAEPEHAGEAESYAAPFDYTEEPEPIAEAHTYAEPFDYGEAPEPIAETYGYTNGYGSTGLSTSTHNGAYRDDSFAEAHTGTAVVAAPTSAPIPGTTLRRVEGRHGSVTWTLDQLQGIKQLGAGPAGSLALATTPVVGPVVNLGPAGSLAADFELRWRHDGRSLGDVEIVNTRVAEASGARLQISATIADDPNVYTTTPPSEARFGALKVTFHYRFSQPGGQSDMSAHTDVTLYGNGTTGKVYRWS